MKTQRVRTCGNPDFGFDCVCKFVQDNPGDIDFNCEFCGIYSASKARCSDCQKDHPQIIITKSTDKPAEVRITKENDQSRADKFGPSPPYIPWYND